MEKRGIVCLWKSLEARGWETYEKFKNGPKKKLPVDRASVHAANKIKAAAGGKIWARKPRREVLAGKSCGGNVFGAKSSGGKDVAGKAA